METLQNIKSDLVRTANHLDELSKAMAGHALFVEARGSSEGEDVRDHIKSIDVVVDELRSVASKISEEE